jgi:hypothetical protein
MTQWTKEQYEELSKNVAEKFNISSQTYEYLGNETHFNVLSLHDDWGRLMELCVKHGVDAQHGYHNQSSSASDSVEAAFSIGDDHQFSIDVMYSEHNNDKSLSERVARMLALLEVEL